MALPQKRKSRWSSRSFFGLKTNQKKTFPSKPSLGVGDATLDFREPYVESPEALRSSQMSNASSNTVEKIRHRGSRLLSIVRLYGSANDRRSADNFEEADVRSSNTTPTNKDSALCLDPKVVSRTFSSEARPTSQLLAAGYFDTSVPAIDPQPTVTEGLRKQYAPDGLRRSRSIPSIAHQLSHKLSNTFGNPTVVHRIHHLARPSIQSLHEKLACDMHSNQKISTQSSTEPSSYSNSSGAFIGGRSTGKTSLSSNVASLHAPGNKDKIDRFEKPIPQGPLKLSQGDARESLLDPIQEKPEIVTPTIVTVETAANAKIFFETYFNTLLSMEKTPRSCRRHELEARLRMEAFTAEQCHRERALWALQESDQLRQTRVLKSKASTVAGRSGVSLAGFEVVKVLGKGSFGVVRLVRQRDSTHDEQSTRSSLASAEPSKKFAPREETMNFRTSTMEIFRSTLDSQRAAQRRETKKTKNEVYAMKVIRKSDMLRNSQEGHIRAERDFLVSSENSRWVVPLVASFQDSTNLYLVMEYMVGGDFLGLLFRKDVLKEKKARWYVAEMILCVEEAHRLRWIHRDVKPDNFLISTSGHLKISDFGLAFDGHWAHDQSFFTNHRQSLMDKLGIKVEGDSLDRKEGAEIAAGMALANAIIGRKGRRQTPQIDGPGEKEEILRWRNRCGNRKLARSVVGTSQYMAPEVIRGEAYDGRCDWWSIGIILYEVEALAGTDGLLLT
ncbi:MAG: hypothetical protein Q9196_000432 [Gyalolechia fulgens]